VTTLVTGGAGFIGSHVVDRLLARGERVVVLDSLDEQVHPDGEWPAYLDVRATRVLGDVGDSHAVASALDECRAHREWGGGAIRVLHLAAKVGVGQSAYEIGEYVEQNVAATARFFAALLDLAGGEIERVVTAGSMSCYGEGRYEWTQPGGATRSGKGVIRSEEALAAREWDDVLPPHGVGEARPIPTGEGTPFVCTSIYAETKRSQEEITRIVGDQHGISWAVARFFNVYGSRQSVRNPYTGVAAIFSSQIRSGRAPTIYEDGEQSRDFIDVRDVAAAVCTLLDDRSTGAFNVGTGARTSIRLLAETLLDLYDATDLGVAIRGTYRVGDVRHCFANADRLRALGWAPTISLDRGLADLAAWAARTEVEDRTALAHDELARRGLIR